MKHTITNIEFFEKTQNVSRHICVTFKDGREVFIWPLATVGQKTYEQTGAEASYLWESLPIAKASIKWLHGSDYKPNVKRFIKAQ